MFGLGKRKVIKVDNGLYAPFDGEVFEIEKVSDPIFSQKVLGDGIAIQPVSSEVFAPVSGKVTVLQAHAIGFVRSDGLEVLLHLGIDTVDLSEDAFHLTVKVGDVLEGGQKCGEVDWAKVSKAQLEQTSMIIFTNRVGKLERFEVDYGPSLAGNAIGEVSVSR